VQVVRQSGYCRVENRAASDQTETARLECYRSKGAITKVTVQTSLMSGRHHNVQRKRRPFPGDVFFDLQVGNQLLSLVSILMP
jgi:hypothetical protein